MTQSSEAVVPQGSGVHGEAVVTIDRPVDELYAFWRTPTQLPRILNDVESVHLPDDQHVRWTLRLPGGSTNTFDAEIYTDVPNEVISWRSLPNSPIQAAAAVRFRPAPADRGCEVQLSVEFVPPAGALGRALLQLFQVVPDEYVASFLRDFKRVMESGELATNDGQPSGREKEQRA